MVKIACSKTSDDKASPECSRLVCESKKGSSVCTRKVGSKPILGEVSCKSEGSAVECSRKVCEGKTCTLKPGKILKPGEIDCSKNADKDCQALVCGGNKQCLSIAKSEQKPHHVSCKKIGNADECAISVCRDIKCEVISIYDGKRNDIKCDPNDPESKVCWSPGCDHNYQCVKFSKEDEENKSGDCTMPDPDPDSRFHRQCFHMGCPDYPTEEGSCIKVKGPGNDDQRCKNNECPKPPFEIPSLIPDVSLPDVSWRCVAPYICLPTVNGEGEQCSESSDCKFEFPRKAQLSNFSNDKETRSEKYSLKKLKTLSAYGALKAPVVLEVFLDHTCGMCRHAFNEVIIELANKYVKTGKLLVIFREFPLLLTDEALGYAEAALCVNKINKNAYANYIASVYSGTEDRKKYNPKVLTTYASEIGLDRNRFEDCLSKDEMLKFINRDIKLGEKRKIDGTPTFFINGKKLVGARPLEEFVQRIEKELKKK